MPATRADVLAVIGAYAGNSSENRAGKGETMIDVLGLQIPTQAIGALALFFGAGLAAILCLESLTPPEPLKPWRWGEAPRRAPRASDIFLSNAIGAALAAAMIVAVLSATA